MWNKDSEIAAAKLDQMLADWSRRTGQPITQEARDAAADLQKRFDELVAVAGPEQAIAALRKLADAFERRGRS